MTATQSITFVFLWSSIWCKRLWNTLLYFRRRHILLFIYITWTKSIGCLWTTFWISCRTMVDTTWISTHFNVNFNVCLKVRGIGLFFFFKNQAKSTLWKRFALLRVFGNRRLFNWRINLVGLFQSHLRFNFWWTRFVFFWWLLGLKSLIWNFNFAWMIIYCE